MRPAAREPKPSPAARAVPAATPVAAAPPVARAALLQRAVGNRAAGRVLARWVKHPDPEKKSVMVPDSVAEAIDHFNPPQNT